MSKKRGKNAQILLCDIRKGPFTFGSFSNSQKEHMLYLNNTSSPLSDHEKARNENKSLQLNKRRNSILERRINDKTLYIVNHCQFSGKRSKLGLLFKELCQAIIWLTLSNFFNNFFSATFVKCHLLTSGFTIYYKSWQEIPNTIQAFIS